MISAASIMKPLPVRPIDGIRGTGELAPLPRIRQGHAMQPFNLPFPKPDAPDLADAVRAAAFDRLVNRSVMRPLPVVHPSL